MYDIKKQKEATSNSCVFVFTFKVNIQLKIAECKAQKKIKKFSTILCHCMKVLRSTWKLAFIRTHISKRIILNHQSKEQNCTAKKELLVDILHINTRRTSKIKIVFK